MIQHFKVLPYLFLLFSVSQVKAYQWVRNEFEADELCSFPYKCDSETIAPDNRPRLPVEQPVSPQIIQGRCSTIPTSQSYKAQVGALVCGQSSVIEVRDRIMHSQEKLDANFEFLNVNNRERAQKELLARVGWNHQMKFSVEENWIYQLRRGDYVNCRAYPGYESGGAAENYQTTCYRTGRTETFRRRVNKFKRVCLRANPPPPPPPQAPIGDSGSGQNSGGASQPNPPPAFKYEAPTAPKGSGEDSKSQGDRFDEGWGRGSMIIKDREGRIPAWRGQRRLADRDESATYDSEPQYGCAEWSSPRKYDSYEENVIQPAESLSYSCQKVRFQWCTWFQSQAASQICPEKKTARVTTEYLHDPEWKPGVPGYDDQLPNKFDLLLGESEVVKIYASNQTGTTMVPAFKFANALPGRDKAWNEYSYEAKPRALNCEYKDQDIKINVKTLHRNVQPAPNPLQIPKDENGNPTAFTEFDKRGRPVVLSLINPGRNMVLDRSNLSRIFGEDASNSNPKMTNNQVSLRSDVKVGGISKKFWENTMFWMRLYWMDGKRLVRVTQPVELNINQADPLAEFVNIRLDGQNGIKKLYKLSIPFEGLFGFLGTDVSLDPRREYRLEIKVAQPGFEGIYSSGFTKDIEKQMSGEATKLEDKRAYSESQVIPLKAPQAKRSFWQAFKHWRERRMWRP